MHWSTQQFSKWYLCILCKLQLENFQTDENKDDENDDEDDEEEDVKKRANVDAWASAKL